MSLNRLRLAKLFGQVRVKKAVNIRADGSRRLFGAAVIFGGYAMVKIYNDGKRITAALSGDIDHHAAREIRTELDDVIARSRPELLILDMENVGFMDSSGIGLILGRSRALRAVGGELLVKNARREIAEVIRISGLGSVIAAQTT